MIRTRFAPSPTGYIHVGGVRTALFAYLVARQANGKFVLRLEDTDKNREVAGSEAHIIESLRDLGLDYDEGPDIGGPFAPYRQSERLDSYKQWADKLIAAGRAYIDPYTPDEIQAFRDAAMADKKPFLYRNHRPDPTPVPNDWYGKYPLRFRSDPKPYNWHDAVMGDLSTGAEVIDDFVLIKSDGYPTYNFAHIVDDAEMKITHIIRGQEFISSQPNYLNLYDALGLEPPIIATVPHILNETGNKKLGKRDGAKDVLDYLRDGILVESLNNFIASMGWNDGTETEIFSMSDLIAKFTLDRVGRSGARFDEKRLLWLNGQWIKKLSLDELYARTLGNKVIARSATTKQSSNNYASKAREQLHDDNFWGKFGQKATEERRLEVLAVVQDRLKTLAELPDLTEYFFHRPEPNWDMVDDNQQLSKLSRNEQIELLRAAVAKLEKQDTDASVIARSVATKQSSEIYDSPVTPRRSAPRDDTGWTVVSLQESLNDLLTKTNSKPAILFSLIRYALTWAPFSPGLPETMVVLGRDETIDRLRRVIL